jgi:thiol-disulfide isomerase/thioredoxin
MAAVIVQTVTQQTTWETVLTLIFFSLGAAVPMFTLILMGRRIMEQVSYLKSYTRVIRKILGVIILASVIFSAWPQGAWSAPSSEGNTPPEYGLKNGVSSPYLAPQIAGIEHWVNSVPLRLDQLKGKVVLIDFWTYSCINCVRTLPFLTKWDEAYRDKGLVIIGIHTPEFEFEKKLDNVKNAVMKHNIQYAVALDNNFKTWLNFQNKYWPAHYLINREGKVVYVHFGEGNYDVTESNIRFLLGLTSTLEPAKVKEISVNDLTPETYLGYGRAAGFIQQSVMTPDRSFDYPNLKDIPLNSWSLEGKWIVEKQRITAQEAGAKIKLHFRARKVFLVLSSGAEKSVTAKISLNGHLVDKESGTDVHQNEVTVTKDTLYELISLDSLQEGILEIQASEPELQAYAFTFEG